MPGGISIDSLGDLVKGTLKNMGRFKWQNLATSLQEYAVWTRLMKKDQIIEQGGTGIEFNAMTRLLNGARWTRLYDRDTVVVGDVMNKGRVDWRHMVQSYGMDRREITMNGPSAKQIFDLLKIRRDESHLSMAGFVNGAFWAPAPAASDTLTPLSVNYWIVANASTGFNGGAPSGHSTVGNIDLNAVPNYKNYTGQYTAVSRDDLLAMLRKAFAFCEFKSPIPMPQYSNRVRRELYCRYDTQAEIEKLLEDLNGSVSARDLDKSGNLLLFKGVPINWDPQLESTTLNYPIYGINWDSFHPVFLSGEIFRESDRISNEDAHNMWAVFIDATFNFICYDRRTNFVFTKA